MKTNRKGKAAVIAAGALLTLSLGTVTAFAGSRAGAGFLRLIEANARNNEDGAAIDGDAAFYKADFEPGFVPPDCFGPIMSKVEDGVMYFSFDGGETWSEEIPEDYGFEIGEDGSTRAWFGCPFIGKGEWDGELPEWFNDPPEWFGSLPEWDGEVPEWFGKRPEWDGELPELFRDGFESKDGEDGLYRHRLGPRPFIDYGEWDGELPDLPKDVFGFEDGEGREFHKFGFRSGLDGGSLMVRIEDGVASYSTDGGETWSDEAPDGVTIEPDGRTMFRMQTYN